MEIRRCSAAGERGITSINTRWGHFQWDETGLLTEFRPAEANSLNQPPYGYGGGRGKITCAACISRRGSAPSGGASCRISGA